MREKCSRPVELEEIPLTNVTNKMSVAVVGTPTALCTFVKLVRREAHSEMSRKCILEVKAATRRSSDFTYDL